MLETSDAKLEDLASDLSNRQTSLTKLQSELSTVTVLSEGYKQRASEMLTGLLKDIYDMGLVSPSQIAANVLNEKLMREGDVGANGDAKLDTDLDGNKENDASLAMAESTSNGDGFSKIDDEFTAARLLVSKVKSEVQTLQERCEKLDGTTNNAQKELEAKTLELKETKVKLHHHENRVQTLSTCMKDVESKRRVLEDSVLELQQEIGRLRGQEQAQIMQASSNNEGNAADLSAALEAQKQQYKVQSDLIRQEIDQKQEKIDKLEEIHSNLGQGGRRIIFQKKTFFNFSSFPKPPSFPYKPKSPPSTPKTNPSPTKKKKSNRASLPCKTSPTNEAKPAPISAA